MCVKSEFNDKVLHMVNDSVQRWSVNCQSTLLSIFHDNAFNTIYFTINITFRIDLITFVFFNYYYFNITFIILLIFKYY